MDGTNSDCSSNPDPRIYAQVSVSSAAWSNQWSFSTDNVSSGTNGNCGMTCNAGSCGSCGFGVAYSGNANWSTTQTLPQNWQVNLYGYEDDGGCPFDSNDGDCYSYSMVNNTNVLSYGNPNCTGGYYTGSNFRDCTSDGTTYRYTADWRFRYYFVGLTDANAGGTPSGPDKLCAGSTASFTITEPLSGRYNSVNWQLNGTDVSGATGASYTSGVLNAGLYTFRRRSVYCTNFSSGTTTVYSSGYNVAVFPAAPTITATANSCGAMFALPTVAAVTGFTVQYSLDGGGWTTSPSTTTPGCHTIKARYVLTNAWGNNAAGTVAPTGCVESNTVSITIYPPTPSLTAPSNVCAGNTFSLPSVTDYSASGFTTQYSIDAGGYSATPTIPTTAGCHTIAARYLLNSACGNTTAGTGNCVSNTVSVVTFPTAPSITATANTCSGTAFSMPTVTAVSGFSVQYSIDGGAFAASPSTTAVGCHDVRARYVLANTCGTNAVGTTPPAGCDVSNTVYTTIFPSAPSLTAPTNVCEGTAFTLPSVTAVSGFNVEYSVDGLVYSTSPTVPTTTGCHTVRARYVLASACGSSAAGSTAPAGCLESAVVSVTTFPSAPVITAPAAVCAGTAFTLPSVPAVSGFTVQYSIDGSAYSATPTVPTTAASCRNIKARYVLTSACGGTGSGATGSGLCIESNTVSVTTFPAAPTITATANTCAGSAFSLPTVAPVSGFTVQYSIDGGAYAASPTVPTTAGCHTIKARYVVTSACGASAAGASAPTGCVESNTVSVTTFPAIPVLTAPSNVCAGSSFVLPSVTDYSASGFTTQYSINGGAYSTSPAIPTTAGCHSVKARYVLTAACGSTAAGSAALSGCTESAAVNVVVFPTAPTITATANTCSGTAFSMPTVAAVAGFTVQYSIDGGAFATSPSTTAVGCHTVQARYVLTSACGTNAALTAPPAGCDASNTVSVTIFPTKPTLTAPSNVCEGTAFTLPTVSAVAGYDIEYSIDGLIYSTSPTIPTTPGCHTVKARYVLASDCGNTLAGATAPALCLESNTVSVVVFPTAPTITATSNTCAGTAFSLPAVSAVSGFTVQYSIDGGAFATAPSATTAGCHTVKARYVLTAACGTNAAGTTPPAGCTESNTVSVTIFPTKPTITATANTCEGTGFTLPTVTAVAGFTVEYNIDGAGYSSSPTVPTTPGCHNVQARYVLTSDCDGSLAGSTGPALCLESNTVSIVIFPTQPTLTPPSNTCAGTAFTLPTVTPVAGFTVQYSVNGGAYSTSPSVPTTAGCHSVKARYVLNSACGTNAANTTAPAGCLESASVNVVIFPSAPVISATSNTCSGTSFSLPSVAAVSGFTVEYNIDGGGYTSSPSAPSTPGCHTVQARYVLTAACGTNASGTTAPAGCLESNTASIVVFPAVPVLTAPSNVCEGSSFTLPSVTPVTDFTVEYSIDGAIYATSPTIPTTPGCHTVKARYVLTAACGANASGTTAPGGCLESATVSVVVFPTAPVISDPANTCAGTAFTLPTVTAVSGFTVQYSINGGAFSASPSVPTAAGSYTVEAQYALTSACGGNPANSIGSGACGVSNTANVTIYALPSLTAPTPASQTVCLNGAPTAISTTASGGTPSAYSYQWYENTTNSTTGGSALGTSSSIFTATSSLGTLYYYCVVTQPESGCTFKTTTTASVTVVALPTPGTLTKTPNAVDVCEGANVSAVATAGSGGTGTITDVLEYRRDDGAGFHAWTPYTSGTPISTTGYVAIEIQTYRTATGSGCNTSTTTTVSWVVNPQPVAGTLAKTPNTTNVCEGTSVSAVLTAGSGGAGTITDVLEYRFNGTGGWTTYTSGASLSTTGRTLVEIRTYRTATGTSCTSPSSTNTVSWDVDPAPVATPVVDYISTCDATAQISYTVSNPGTFSWSKVSGSGSPSTSSDNPLIVTSLTPGATSVYQLLGSLPGCTNLNMGTVNLSLPTNSSSTLASSASCNYCVINDGNLRHFYNSSGELIASIEDDNAVSPDKLDGTEVCVRLDGSVQTILDNYGYLQPYLTRQWTIHPANNTSSKVTLYFTNAELGALQSAANSTVYQFSGYQLGVTKYPGGQNGTFTPPCTGGTPGCGQVTAEFVPAVFSAYGASNHKAEFNISTFSTFYIHPMLYPFAPLPVELVSFTGWNQGSVNRLQWITASEQNTARFEIQKSITPGVWTPIGDKAAAGNSNSRLTYDFTDNNPVVGNNYYRLKVIDNDGTFSYTNVINIPVSDAFANNFTRIYPNPTNGLLNVEIQSTGVYDTKISVYDVLGKVVLDKVSSLSKGLNTLNFDFSNISNGTYIMQFSDSDGKIHTTKFVKD